MLLDFLRENRDELIARARVRVASRPAPRANAVEMEKGIPIFLTQLTEIFRLETMGNGNGEDPGALGKTAAMHGAELLKNGYTVAQAINDYGDICQVVTQLAGEMKAKITVEEYNTFNRCLDDAMANAVSEYLRGREQMISAEEVERLGVLAHEQRNLLSAAMLAFQVLRSGSVGMDGSTSAVLGRSLIALRDLTDRSLAEVRFAAGLHHSERIELAAFIEQIEAAATMEARVKGLQLTVIPPRYGTAVDADRQLLGSALGNLLSNAFKFSRPGGHIVLRTIVRAGKLAIEVEDECGGLPPEKAEELFRPFDQRSGDRTGLGLGLTIAHDVIVAHGGRLTLEASTLPPGRPGTIGAAFVISLPMDPD